MAAKFDEEEMKDMLVDLHSPVYQHLLARANYNVDENSYLTLTTYLQNLSLIEESFNKNKAHGNSNHTVHKAIKKAIFMHADKMYQCSFWVDLNEIRIKNEQGDILVVQKGQRIGLLGKNRQQAREVNVTEPRFYTLIKVAIKALAI